MPLDKLNISVLYVEDDEGSRRRTIKMLERRVRSIITATNGQEGLNLFRQNKPDIVITDIRMPIMDGIEMANVIKNENYDIPIIITTAYADTDYLISSINIGVDHYLLKPIDSKHLNEALNKCVTYKNAKLAEYSLRDIALKEKIEHEERMRLSRELHDGIGQSLLAIKLGLQMLDTKIQNEVSMTREDISELIIGVSNTLEELKCLAISLRSPLPDNISLASAVSMCSERLSKASGVNIISKMSGDIETLPRDFKEHIYRICQEAVVNAVKHSGADAINVFIEKNGRNISVVIMDNGKGFDSFYYRPSGKGIGLSTIKERVQLMKGTMRIHSSDDKGSTLRIEAQLHD